MTEYKKILIAGLIIVLGVSLIQICQAEQATSSLLVPPEIKQLRNKSTEIFQKVFDSIKNPEQSQGFIREIIQTGKKLFKVVGKALIWILEKLVNLIKRGVETI